MSAALPSGDGIIGMQVFNGQFVMFRSHECAKDTCATAVEVAVFGKIDGNGHKVGRFNVCRAHVADVMGDLYDPWMCALVQPREGGRDYCPHCAARTVRSDGTGHLVVCPIGQTFPTIMARARQLRLVADVESHERDGCEVCMSYDQHRPGPTG